MDKEVYSNFYFDSYRVNNISFYINKQFEKGEVEIDFNVESNLSVNEEQNKARIIFELILWDEPEKNNLPFKLSLKAEGYFSADESMNKEHFIKMCKYNGNAILFPFIRSAVLDITKTSNFGPPVALPLININSLIDHKKSKMN